MVYLLIGYIIYPFRGENLYNIYIHCIGKNEKRKYKKSVFYYRVDVIFLKDFGKKQPT
jgi:hypothetical protein